MPPGFDPQKCLRSLVYMAVECHGEYLVHGRPGGDGLRAMQKFCWLEAIGHAVDLTFGHARLRSAVAAAFETAPPSPLRPEQRPGWNWQRVDAVLARLATEDPAR